MQNWKILTSMISNSLLTLKMVQGNQNQYECVTLNGGFHCLSTCVYLSLDLESHRGTTNDLGTSCLHLCLSSTALCDYGKSSPVHSLMLSSPHFLCCSLLLAPLTAPCKMVFARSDDLETCLYRFNFHLFTVARSS